MTDRDRQSPPKADPEVWLIVLMALCVIGSAAAFGALANEW